MEDYKNALRHMNKEELLRVLYPGRETFTVEEMDVAGRILCSCTVKVRKFGRCDKRPWVFVPIGGKIKVGGKVYECVKAGVTLLPSQACSGCDLKSGRVQCIKYQCSPFDRSDGKFTWFREVDNVK